MEKRLALGAHPNSYRALSLVELIVALAIISLLLAIAMPAIHKARDASRRVTCVSHLAQIGSAIHSHVSSNLQYPGPFRTKMSAGDPGPHVKLLPFLDQAALYLQYDTAESNQGGAGQQPPTSTHNSALLTRRVPTYICPSDGGFGNIESLGGNSYRASTGTSGGLYTASTGDLEQDANAGFLSAKGPASVTDGLSTTAFFSERLVGDFSVSAYRPDRDWIDAVPQGPTAGDVFNTCRSVSPYGIHYSFLGATWLFDSNFQTRYSHILAPNSSVPDCILGEGAISARSLHVGGVNTLFGDGHVQFINENIQLGIWRAISTISASEKVGSP